MKRVLAIVLVVAVMAAAWFTYSGFQAQEPELPEGITTTKVTRNSIDATINAIGSLAAERVGSVTANAAGTVAEMFVQEGDQVKAGDLLYRLDDADIRLSIKQSEAALKVAEAALARTAKPASEAEIVAAQAAISSTKASLTDLLAGPSYRDRQLSQLQLDQARNNLWAAQGNRDAIAGNPLASGGSITQAEAAIANAELAIQIAEINRGKLFEPPKDSQISAAESQIVQAESNLARLLSLPSAEDIASARAQVAQAQVNLEITQARLDDLEMTAPFGGLLTSWNVYVGDSVAPGAPMGTLVDQSCYHLNLTIDETEISKVKLGALALIEMDAFPDVVLEGNVSRIDLVGSNAQGIVNYGVRIDCPGTDLPIRPLMTAAIDIITESKSDVLAVLTRTVRRDANGKYVEVIRGSTLDKVYITTGIADDTYTEILDGLEEGQEVVLTRPRDSLFAGAGPFGGG